MYKVYRTAVEALTSYGKRIKSGEEAQQLKGISIKVAEQIGDFLNTEKVYFIYTSTLFNFGLLLYRWYLKFF